MYIHRQTRRVTDGAGGSNLRRKKKKQNSSLYARMHKNSQERSPYNSRCICSCSPRKTGKLRLRGSDESIARKARHRRIESPKALVCCVCPNTSSPLCGGGLWCARCNECGRVHCQCVRVALQRSQLNGGQIVFKPSIRLLGNNTNTVQKRTTLTAPVRQ